MELRHLAWIVALVLVGCQREQWDDCVTGTGPVRTEERSVGAYTIIELNDRIDLVLEPRAAGTVSVEGGSNLLGQVVTEVRAGTLVVRNDMKCNWVRSFKPVITVRVPVEGAAELVLRGTGRVSATATVVRPVFRITQHDAQGVVELTVVADTCYVGLHTGAGTVKVAGTCGVAYLYSGFMGPIEAGALAAQEVNVNNTSVVDITCRAAIQLNAQVNSVGSVRYYGDPQVHTTGQGSGQVVRLGP
ncbi:MAG: DUF2807 domain-containing protein [Flavobacteriales bacterium]|nr:DUF2807 domain-containing protein [Flavobacteriales bacterium]